MLITPEFDPQPVIAFQGVWKTYPNGADALRDVSLSIPAGDFAFLVGASGAGKSSLVRLLIREELPTRGRLVVQGRDVAGLTRRDLPHFRRRIGLVFQDFRLLPRLTVHENVAFALRTLGESRRTINRRTKAALERVGLAGQGTKYPSEMSGGEQQRVAIARALIHEPKLVVADEPTGNLDPATAWEIMQILLRVNATGSTVVMATHNREIVNMMRRRVVALDHGRVTRDDRFGRYHEDAPAPAVCAQ